MSRIERRRVRTALRGLEFPADKATLLVYAEHRRARPRTLRALSALPAGDYADLGEVEAAMPRRSGTPPRG